MTNYKPFTSKLLTTSVWGLWLPTEFRLACLMYLALFPVLNSLVKLEVLQFVALAGHLQSHN